MAVAEAAFFWQLGIIPVAEAAWQPAVCCRAAAVAAVGVVAV